MGKWILKNKKNLKSTRYQWKIIIFSYSRVIQRTLKNEIGRISKVILDKINSNLIKQVKVNQWKNAQNIHWFIKIDKQQSQIPNIQYYKYFYPSIKETQFIKGINFTKKLINVPNEDEVIVKQLRKSLIYDNNKSWVKKELIYSLYVWALPMEPRYVSW